MKDVHPEIRTAPMRAGSAPARAIVRRACAVLATLCAAGLAPAAPGHAASAHLYGFRATNEAAERAREAEAVAGLRADSLRVHLRRLTEEPHVAGTPADHATAVYVRDLLASYGWDASIVAIPVWLNYPKRTVVELIEPVRRPLATREGGEEWDKDSFDDAAFGAFHGYAGSGDVTDDVVYANYGDVGDFKKLAELGIDVRGRIVLMRYGRIFRGLKVRNAQNAGAAGVIIYSDPADDGYDQGDPYPRGTARPADAIQRGSVQFLSEAPGDPTTPGWPSREGGRRLTAAEAHGVPRIPSLPMSWGEAQKILAALDGPSVPDGWQGGLSFRYHVGPGPAKVHMEVEQDYAVRPIWDVIAKLPGRERADEWVVCGNHRDAWTYGAVDPNSGTICMLELARTIGALTKSGWRPRRTLMLCSWDGEEYGLLGSTEWAEANAQDLEQHALAYINVDTAVSGADFAAAASHALQDVLVQTADDVTVPGHAATVLAEWTARARAAGVAEWARQNRERRWRGEPERRFDVSVNSLGSGSDYTAFEDHLGVPSLDMRFSGLEGTYHSMYDDFEFVDRNVDPGYVRHLAMSELWTRLVMRLGDADVAPLHYSTTGQFVLDELQSLDDRLDDANVSAADSSHRLRVEFAPLRVAATRLRDAGRALELRVESALAGSDDVPGGAAALDHTLLGVERTLLGDGLPGRPWFRNELYAPGLNTGYAPVPLPRLGQALLDRDVAALGAAGPPLRAALDRAAERLAAAH
ncbi:MAG TPA: M28 family metallopeptidase [Candidatus Eisenbacteria bacterium]|nr:M28 family metallopeptidase [Candidatus Eisenbacteria bacterium]